MELAAPHCPPEPEDTGKFESPAERRPASAAHPSSRRPSGRGWCSCQCRCRSCPSRQSPHRARPDGHGRRTWSPARRGRRSATPIPTSHRPSFTWPGRALRLFQPKRSAPTCRQRTSWRCGRTAARRISAGSAPAPPSCPADRRHPGGGVLSGTTCVSLRMRRATGSIASCSANSSIAISSAMWPVASPGARMALASGRSSTDKRVAVMRLGPAYSIRVC